MRGCAGVLIRHALRCCLTASRTSSRIVFLNAALKPAGIGFRPAIPTFAYIDMTASPLFPGFDGLMTLSRREGVDIRPTLLRVLTDLYVQAARHSPDEQRQFVELTSRLIDQVDDATRAAVRARLAIYPLKPVEIMRQLTIRTALPNQAVPVAEKIPSLPTEAAEPRPLNDAEKLTASNLA